MLRPVAVVRPTMTVMSPNIRYCLSLKLRQYPIFPGPCHLKRNPCRFAEVRKIVRPPKNGEGARPAKDMPMVYLTDDEFCRKTVQGP
jgi:hypothetical protein